MLADSESVVEFGWRLPEIKPHYKGCFLHPFYCVLLWCLKSHNKQLEITLCTAPWCLTSVVKVIYEIHAGIGHLFIPISFLSFKNKKIKNKKVNKTVIVKQIWTNSERLPTEVSHMWFQKSTAALVSCYANPFVLEWALRHSKPALCATKIKEYMLDFRKNHRGQQRGSHILWPKGNTAKMIRFYKWAPPRSSLTPSEQILSMYMDQQLCKKANAAIGNQWW